MHLNRHAYASNPHRGGTPTESAASPCMFDTMHLTRCPKNTMVPYDHGCRVVVISISYMFASLHGH